MADANAACAFGFSHGLVFIAWGLDGQAAGVVPRPAPERRLRKSMETHISADEWCRVRRRIALASGARFQFEDYAPADPV